MDQVENAPQHVGMAVAGKNVLQTEQDRAGTEKLHLGAGAAVKDAWEASNRALPPDDSKSAKRQKLHGIEWEGKSSVAAQAAIEVPGRSEFTKAEFQKIAAMYAATLPKLMAEEYLDQAYAVGLETEEGQRLHDLASLACD